jgi:hypothetical protein
MKLEIADLQAEIAPPPECKMLGRFTLGRAQTYQLTAPEISAIMHSASAMDRTGDFAALAQQNLLKQFAHARLIGNSPGPVNRLRSRPDFAKSFALCREVTARPELLPVFVDVLQLVPKTVLELERAERLAASLYFSGKDVFQPQTAFFDRRLHLQTSVPGQICRTTSLRASGSRRLYLHRLRRVKIVVGSFVLF